MNRSLAIIQSGGSGETTAQERITPHELCRRVRRDSLDSPPSWL